MAADSGEFISSKYSRSNPNFFYLFSFDSPFHTINNKTIFNRFSFSLIFARHVAYVLLTLHLNFATIFFATHAVSRKKCDMHAVHVHHVRIFSTTHVALERATRLRKIYLLGNSLRRKFSILFTMANAINYI